MLKKSGKQYYYTNNPFLYDHIIVVIVTHTKEVL